MTFAASGIRVLSVVLLVIFLAATLGGIFDPTPGPDRPQLLPGGVIVTGLLLLIFRSGRIRVTVDETTVTIVGWFTVRHIAKASIGRVETADYSGVYNRWSTTRLFHMIVLELHEGGVINLPILTGNQKKIHRMADEFNHVLGTAYHSKTPDTITASPEGHHSGDYEPRHAFPPDER